MPDQKNPSGCCSNDTCCTGDLKATVKGSTCTVLNCAVFPETGSGTWSTGGGAWSLTMSCDSAGVYTVTFSFSPVSCGGTGWSRSFKDSILDCSNFQLQKEIGQVPSNCLPFGCGGQTLTVTIQSSC